MARIDDDGDMEAGLTALLVAVGTNGDVEAFEALFRHFAPRIKAYLSRGGAASADELMQEAMLIVWRRAALYDPSKGSAAAWIFAIARNLRIDAYRREKRPEFDPSDPALVPDGEEPADMRLAASEDAERLKQALTQLPPDQAEVLNRSFFSDQSQSEIAAELKVPLGTVKSRMRLAFAKLKAALRGTGEES